MAYVADRLQCRQFVVGECVTAQACIVAIVKPAQRASYGQK